MGKIKFTRRISSTEALDILNSLHTGEQCMRNYVAEYIGITEAETDRNKLLYYRKKLIEVSKKITQPKTQPPKNRFS